MGLINSINCNKENLGLGTVSCEIFLNEFKTPILVRRGWSVTKEVFEAYTYEDFVGLVQTGVLQPITGSKQFTNNTPDPTTEEYSGGIISVIRNGKPQYQFDYDKGVGFHKALYSKNSLSNYDMMLADASGNLVFAESADGLRISGFETSMVNTRTYMPKSGDTSANTAFEFQLANEDQFNKRMAVYTSEESGIDFNSELRAINSVTITGTAAAGDPIEVIVKATGNTNFGIEGLTATDFRVVNTATNTVIPITSVSSGANAGTYLLTPTTPLVAAETLKVSTYDDTVEVNVALLDAIQPYLLYQGESEVITVTA